MPTKLQIRADSIMRADPSLTPAKAMIMAGYSSKTALNSKRELLDSKGFGSLRDVYQYELTRKGVTPKLLAKKVKEGLKGKDSKTSVLAYVESAKKDFDISKESVDTAIQINLEGTLKEYAK